MIQLKSTPNHAGLSLKGTAAELDALLNAIGVVAGDGENVPAGLVSARSRVVGLRDRLNEQLKGERGSGEDSVTVKAYWPETIFVWAALNNCIRQSYRSAKTSEWDLAVAAIRKFQNQVVDCLRMTVKDFSAARAFQALGTQTFVEDNYIVQFLDEQNVGHLALDSAEKRLRNLPAVTKLLIEQGPEYRKFKQSVLDAARQHQISVEEIGINSEYPKESNILW
ncbi:DUF6904 family protein [Cohnella thailandensis]|uniref:Uncharacterized protein n=1 Tax=Cohnella thailandensis TaxID=557557 RepID=A0A841SYG2_9BACL|nr:hypothetical protein [Cohnella thailandensis]MBB6635208.1 hypothetical protein [Cohnella thailandensis]MBP1974326.1 hypothetical protein [Cohnella thailandensis]